MENFSLLTIKEVQNRKIYKRDFDDKQMLANKILKSVGNGLVTILLATSLSCGKSDSPSISHPVTLNGRITGKQSRVKVSTNDFGVNQYKVLYAVDIYPPSSLLWNNELDHNYHYYDSPHNKIFLNLNVGSEIPSFLDENKGIEFTLTSGFTKTREDNGKPLYSIESYPEGVLNKATKLTLTYD